MTKPGGAYIQSDTSDAPDQKSVHPSASDDQRTARFDDEWCEAYGGYFLLGIVITVTAITFYGALAVFLWKFT